MILEVAASETGRAQTSVRACWGYGLHKSLWKVKGTVLGKPAREGESPVSERSIGMAVSRVGRDTWNLD